MNMKPLLIVIAVIVLLIVGYLVFGKNQASAPTQTATTTDTGAGAQAPVSASTTTTVTTPSGSSKGVTITYGPNGFSPTNVTVKAGTTVTWVNNGGGRMWVGSNDHPTHTRYDGTSTGDHCANGTATSASVFDQCGAGSSFSFTFTKAGTWNYHNHAAASDHGTVTVTP